MKRHPYLIGILGLQRIKNDNFYGLPYYITSLKLIVYSKNKNPRITISRKRFRK